MIVDVHALHFTRIFAFATGYWRIWGHNIEQNASYDVTCLVSDVIIVYKHAWEHGRQDMYVHVTSDAFYCLAWKIFHIDENLSLQQWLIK